MMAMSKRRRASRNPELDLKIRAADGVIFAPPNTTSQSVRPKNAVDWLSPGFSLKEARWILGGWRLMAPAPANIIFAKPSSLRAIVMPRPEIS
jgi:hypothetical protein